MESRLKKELDQMEKQGVTDKPIGSTEWLNNLSIRAKGDGRLHICIDPKHLNKAIKWKHHPAPTLKQLTPKLCGSTFFFKIKCKTRLLGCETVCGIIIHGSFLHTLWEIQMLENNFWVEDEYRHLPEED